MRGTARWEVFAESLEDYAMLQTAGVDPDDALLEDIRTYAEFPKTQGWITEATARVLARQDR